MTIQQTIFAYIFGSLSNMDKKEWESNLLQNPALKADIQALRALLAEKKLTTFEIYEAFEKRKQDNTEVEQHLEKVEYLLRRISHRDFIMSFLEGNVSPKEQASFEEELQTDANLQQRVFEMKKMQALFKSAHNAQKAQAIWEYIQTEEQKGKQQQDKEQNTSSSRPLWQQNWFRMAASLLLLAVVGLGIWKIITPKEHDAQYYASTYLAQPYAISGSMGKGDDLEQLIGLYQAGEYATVAEKLEKAPISEPKAQMMQANCYLKLQKWDAAAALFTTLQSHNKYGQDAQFYLALTYTLQGNKTQAIKLLEALQQQTLAEELKQKVTSLLKDLR